MKRQFIFLGILFFSIFLISSFSSAGTITADLIKPYNYTIMQTESRLDILIKNTSTTPTDIISQILFNFPTGYIITGGSAPNWVVQWLASPRITFQASNCAYTLDPGEELLFTINVIPPTGAINSSDSLVSIQATRNRGLNGCRNVSNSSLTNQPTYTRYSLFTSIDASPQTVNIGSDITVVYSVTNKTSGTVNNIVPTIQKLSSDGADCTLSSPTPASLNLTSGSTGYFTYTCNATLSGTINFSGYSSSGANISSPTALSPYISIGNFTATMSISPLAIVSGDDITVIMNVTNWGNTTITNIVPTSDCPLGPGGLCFSGTASSSYVSGPIPSSVGELLPGQSTSFVWSYIITGPVGSTFSFNGFATADGGLSTNKAFSESGNITAYSVSISPSYVLRNSTNKTLTFNVKNSSSVGIKTVTVYNPDTTIWIKAVQSGVPCQGCTWTYTRLTGPERYQFSAANTSCYILQNEECDFTLLFSRVGDASNPPSTTNYSFETRITDAKNVVSRFYNNETVVVSLPPPDVNNLVAVSGNARVKLVWNNPADHDGVLILRTTGTTSNCTPPDTKPADGVQYTIGQVLGNATVIYSDSNGSSTSTYTDNGVANGTIYCYKVFNHNGYFVYSTGDVPSSNGIKGQPTDGVEPSPLWVYSVGIASLFTPAVYPGSNLYTSSNLGTVNSLNPLSGEEFYRPLSLGGVINNRFVVVPLEDGRKMILTGAQNGYAYGIYADTGVVRWSVQLTTEMITAPPAVILRKYANSTYQSKYSTDLAFFGTRNSDRVSNKVYALDPNNGSIVWTFNQSGSYPVDIIVGGPTVDYSNNWLYVASYSGASQNQNSLWILDIINNGALLYAANYGDIDFGVTLSNNRTVANFASKTAGLVYSINASDKSVRWTYNPGLGSGVNFSYLLPLSNGFIFTVSGHLIRIVDNGNSAGTLYDIPISGVTPPLLSITWDKVYVGSNTGTIYQINLSNGSTEFTRNVGYATGYMSADTSLKNIYFGTTDGRIFAFRVPFTK
ncbi:MAG: PQQ-binding-like beta-propeller repeat protein [Myxococcota bacterium]